MAEQFIGLQVIVTLLEPLTLSGRPARQLRGTVSEIVPGISLTMSNISVVGTNSWLPRLSIAAGAISELFEVPDTPVHPTTAAAPEPPVSLPRPSPSMSKQPATQPFIDPAIMSMGMKGYKSPSITLADAQTQPNTSEKRDPQPGQPGVLPAPKFLSESRVSTPRAGGALGEMLSGSMTSLNLDGAVASTQNASNQTTAVPQESQEPSHKSRRRRPKHNRNARGVAEPPSEAQADNNKAPRGKGWRQTPMLQSTSTFQPFTSLNRKGKNSQANNGWASEEVTEGMGDFDFEGSLAKFDKRTLFDQMRKDDQVDDATRLASHNRRPKSGTAGGKNFHNTENVLDMPPSVSRPANDFWNSEADDGIQQSNPLARRDVRSQQSNRRSDSKPGTRRSQSRKTSAAGQPMQRVNSSVRPDAFQRSVESLTGGPTAQQQQQQQQQQRQQPQPVQPGLYLMPSKRRLEPVSALKWRNLENIAANEIGLTEEMMTENCARGITGVTFTALSDPAVKLQLEALGSSPGGAASSATVVILAGNNKSGIRAMAAARHLRNKGVSVLPCVVGVERERDLLEDMKQQMRIFRNFGGRIHSKHELFEYLRKSASSSTPMLVSLIIDALLGLTISFEELRTDDQATVYELMEWANRNEAFVLALDVPTGIDPSSGKVSIIDGGHLYVRPRYVVALGAPKRGLLEAIAAAHEKPDENIPGAAGGGVVPVEAEEDEWKLYIIDMGLGASVWKKAGTKQRRGVDFEDKWVLPMQYLGPKSKEDDDQLEVL